MKPPENVRVTAKSRYARRGIAPGWREAAVLALCCILTAPAHAEDVWRLVGLYGQASAPTSQGFAETGYLAGGREWRIGKGFSLAAELYPFFVVNLTRVDLPDRPRDVVRAVAASPLIAYTLFPERARVRLRLEAGIGVFWGFSPVPAEGSQFNLLDQLGVFLVVRLDSGSSISAGLRRIHMSNLGLAGPDNPGLSFYAAAVAFSWPAPK